MQMIENMVKTTFGEVEKVLSSKTVVGEPIVLGDITLIPLLSVGFGFGAGGGEGKGDPKEKGEGTGGGTGCGAGIKPVAIAVIDKDGVRIEPVRGGLSNAIEKIGLTVPQAVEKLLETVVEKWAETKKQESKP